MADVTIICDASFDERLKLAGFSGNMMIKLDDGQEITQMYDSARAECADVQQSEVSAMILGLMVLKRYASANDIHIDRITIHTDSLTSIRAMQTALMDNSAQTPLRDMLLNMHYMAQKNGWRYTLEKVSAHVPDHRANTIEKIHNMADARAVSARLRLTDHLFKPDLNSKWYSVLLPATVDDSERDKYRDLAYRLAAEGRRARVYVHDDVGSGYDIHPFVDGILAYADDHNLQVDNLMTQMFYMPHKTRDLLDLTLYRFHQNLHELPVSLGGSGSPDERRAEFASSFLFGPAYRSLELQNLTGRQHKASSFVLDLTGDKHEHHSIPYWTTTLLHYVQIPFKRGLEMHDVPLIRVAKPGAIHDQISGKLRRNQDMAYVASSQSSKRPTDLLKIEPLVEQLSCLFDSTRDSNMTAQVLARLFIGKLNSFKCPITNPIAIGSLERSIQTAILNRSADPRKDVEFILKHIVRMQLIDKPVQAAELPPAQPAKRLPAASGAEIKSRAPAVRN